MEPSATVERYCDAAGSHGPLDRHGPRARGGSPSSERDTLYDLDRATRASCCGGGRRRAGTVHLLLAGWPRIARSFGRSRDDRSRGPRTRVGRIGSRRESNRWLVHQSLSLHSGRRRQPRCRCAALRAASRSSGIPPSACARGRRHRLLRYLGTVRRTRIEPTSANYLGQFDQDASVGVWFASESSGRSVDPRGPRRMCSTWPRGRR